MEEHLTLVQLFAQLYLLLNQIRTGAIFTRASLSLALLSLRENEGLLVVYLAKKYRLVHRLLKTDHLRCSLLIIKLWIYFSFRFNKCNPSQPRPLPTSKGGYRVDDFGLRCHLCIWFLW